MIFSITNGQMWTLYMMENVL